MRTLLLSLLLALLFACSEDEQPNNIVVTYMSSLAGEYAAEAKMFGPESVPSHTCPDSIWYGRVKFVAEHEEGIDTIGVYRIFSFNGNGDEVEDPAMGGYYQCFNNASTDPSVLPNGDEEEGTLRLKDDDGVLSWTGASQWGEIYFVSELDVSGVVLFLKFANDYDESFEIRLIREDGSSWPEELRTE